MKFYAMLLLVLTAVGCINSSTGKEGYRNAATVALFDRLQGIMDSGQTLFGVANARTIKYCDRKHSDITRSDVHDITGSHPAYIESDFMWYTDSAFRAADLMAMKEANQHGAVVGYCWHLNGMNSNAFYAPGSDDNLVKEIVTNSDRKSNPALRWYLNLLDSLVVPVFQELEFPLTFRPFHEMNGAWFWWGSNNCTPQEYVTLYKLTVDYLREQGICNVLYVWSPDTYLREEYYPGDDYVDVVGLDVYEPAVTENHPAETYFVESRKLVAFATEHGKVAAITETGCRKRDEHFTYPNQFPDFWSRYVLNPVLENDSVIGLAWIMSWYSSDWNQDGKGQFYVPYEGIEAKFGEKGIAAVNDFMKFYEHPATLFESDLKQ